MAASHDAADAALHDRIRALARSNNAVILAHNYQRPEVQDVADYVGDSLGLSREAARTEADVIVFCGVHFMAESADVLCTPNQQVILPDLAAGCSMADMAAPEQLEMCWNDLAEMGVGGIVPVTYINSAASIKAFVGERGGVVCTSSNAAATLKWAWARGEHPSGERFDRMFLHAQRLRFTHPASGETLQLEAPLPPECQRLVQALKARTSTTAEGA